MSIIGWSPALGLSSLRKKKHQKHGGPIGVNISVSKSEVGSTLPGPGTFTVYWRNSGTLSNEGMLATCWFPPLNSLKSKRFTSTFSLNRSA